MYRWQYAKASIAKGEVSQDRSLARDPQRADLRAVPVASQEPFRASHIASTALLLLHTPPALAHPVPPRERLCARWHAVQLRAATPPGKRQHRGNPRYFRLLAQHTHLNGGHTVYETAFRAAWVKVRRCLRWCRLRLPYR